MRGILKHDLFFRISLDQFLQAFGRVLQFFGVVDDREVGVVEGHEHLVGPAAGNLYIGKIDPGRREQAGGPGFRRQIGVEPKHDIGLGRCALQPDAVEQGDAVGHRDELEVAAAFGLERLFDLRAGAPFGGEAFVGIDGELLLRRGRTDSGGHCKHQGKKQNAHRRLLLKC